MIRLTKRLRTNASLVTPGSRLADVGTDHGYVPIALITEGVIPSAIAMDVNRGPLDRAKEHMEREHLESRMTIRLSDGLKELRPGEADSVLIAGMGGALTIRILQEGTYVLTSVKELILQPQSEIDKVRRYLETAGWRITEEKMTFEEGKYYTVMRAEAGSMHYDRDIDYRYGFLLLQRQDPVLRDYLQERRRICGGIREQLQAQGAAQERTAVRLSEVEGELFGIEEALRCFD